MKWQTKKLGEIISTPTRKPRGLAKSRYKVVGKWPVIDQGADYIAGHTDASELVYEQSFPVIVFGDHTRILKYVDTPFVSGADGVKVLIPNPELNPKFVFFTLVSKPVKNLGYSRHFRLLKQMEYLVPSLSTQQKIVSRLDAVREAQQQNQKLINLAEELFQSTLERELQPKPDWQTKKLGEISTLKTGGTPRRSNPEYYGGDIKWLVSGDIHEKEIFDCDGRITELGVQNSNARLLSSNSVLIALNGQGKTRGTVAILRTEASCNQSLVAVFPNPDLVTEFLYYDLSRRYSELRNLTGANDRSGLNMNILAGIRVAIPSMDVQQKIVGRLDSIREYQNQLKKQKTLLSELFNSLLERLLNPKTCEKYL